MLEPNSCTTNGSTIFSTKFRHRSWVWATVYALIFGTGIVQFLTWARSDRPYCGCAEIVQKSSDASADAVQSPQIPHGNCMAFVQALYRGRAEMLR